LAEEINPTRQRGISVDVLAERLTNHTEQMRSEFAASHHHYAALEAKVESFLDRVGSIETTLHDHISQLHHVGTRDRLLEMSATLLTNERKFSEIDSKFASNETARLVEKAAVEARTKQRSQGLTALQQAWLLIVGAVPIALLLYDRLA
jgi:hypothetical protein